MLSRYFPKCTVVGPIEPPMPFQHLGSRGFVPKKCRDCKMLFEGECNRNTDLNMGWAHLDFGPCGIPGPTDPMIYQDEFVIAKVPVPRKCSTCRFISLDPIRGFHCTKEREKWGDLDRGLDWGDWQPTVPPIGLPYPQRINDRMRELALHGDVVDFIIEFRKENPASIPAAKEAYLELKAALEEATNKPMHPSGGSAGS